MKTDISIIAFVSLIIFLTNGVGLLIAPENRIDLFRTEVFSFILIRNTIGLCNVKERANNLQKLTYAYYSYLSVYFFKSPELKKNIGLI